MKKLVLLLLCSVTSLSLAASSPEISKTPPLKVPSAQLGFGYSADNDQPLTIDCLNVGPVTYSGSSQGVVELSKLYDLNTVKQQLNIQGKAHVDVGLFSASASADFMHYIENDALSETLIYRTRLVFKDSNYNIPKSGPVLNTVGQQANTDPDHFRQVCGDAYVAQMHHGAYLYIVYQLHFMRAIDKQKFDAAFSGSFGDFVDFSGSMQKEIDKLGVQGSLHVIAFQSGGEPQYLSDIFKSPDPMKPSAISQCTFSDLQACNQVMSNIIAYVTTSDQHSFPNQLPLAKGKEVPDAAAVIGREVADYSKIVPIHTNTALTPDVIAARDKIGASLEGTQTQLQRATYLSSAPELSVPFAYDVYKQKLDAQIANLSFNEDLLRNTGLTCFNSISDCLSAEAAAYKALKPVDTSVLTPPETMNVSIDENGTTVSEIFVALDTSNPAQQNFRGAETTPSSGDLQSSVTVSVQGPTIYMIQKNAATGAKIASYQGGTDGPGQYSGTVDFVGGGGYHWSATVQAYGSAEPASGASS